jgi:hypothetical protein
MMGFGRVLSHVAAQRRRTRGCPRSQTDQPNGVCPYVRNNAVILLVTISQCFLVGVGHGDHIRHVLGGAERFENLLNHRAKVKLLLDVIGCRSVYFQSYKELV